MKKILLAVHKESKESTKVDYVYIANKPFGEPPYAPMPFNECEKVDFEPNLDISNDISVVLKELKKLGYDVEVSTFESR
jgi:hypothetical protein